MVKRLLQSNYPLFYKMNLRLRDLSIDELPREKAIKHGIENLSNHELLAILLRTGSQNDNVLNLSYSLLAQHDGLIGLSKMSYVELMSMKGLKKAKSLTLLSAFELARRINEYHQIDIKIEKPEQIFKFFQTMLHRAPQEKFFVVFLNTKNVLTGYKELFIGGLDRNIIHPRDIFRESVKNNAANIILVHNHPSGDSTPSQADIEITSQLCQVGKMMGIAVVDHIIVGQDNFCSLRTMKLMK